jgi:4-amino-4-deoxy-L-arabinose transferase-like glycosyltransferase
LGALVAVFCAINAHWIWSFRYGQPLDIDEAGYLSYAMVDYSNLIHGGLAGWLHAVEAPSAQAPLTTALSALLFYVTGPHIIAGFMVPLLAGAACLVATYYLGCALGSPPAGLLASLLLATCPVTMNYVRSYHFSMLAMLLATLALVALLRSERFSRPGWALLFGICLGLMPLARTMTLAFIPGLLAGAGLHVLSAPNRHIPRLALLAGAAALGAGLLAAWLVPNFTYVAQYLFSFGYGNRAAEYAHCANCGATAVSAHSLLAGWIITIQALVDGDIYLPDFLFICAGGAAAVIYSAVQIAQNGLPSWVRAVWQSPLLPVACFAAEAMVALNSSANKGSAFFAPLMPALFLLSVYFILNLVKAAWYRRGISAIVAVFALAVGVPFLSLTSWAAHPAVASIPVLNGATLSDGRGTIERYESFSYPDGYNQPVDAATGRAWMAASQQTSMTVLAMMGTRAVVTFGFRNHLYNVNTVNLAMIQRTGIAFAMNQIDPQVTGDSVAAYQNWLQTVGANSCVLLTSDHAVPGDFNPPVVRLYMQQAARQAGFTPQGGWALPDGEQITLWVPRQIPAPCQKRAA